MRRVGPFCLDYGRQRQTWKLSLPAEVLKILTTNAKCECTVSSDSFTGGPSSWIQVQTTEKIIILQGGAVARLITGGRVCRIRKQMMHLLSQFHGTSVVVLVDHQYAENVAADPRKGIPPGCVVFLKLARREIFHDAHERLQVRLRGMKDCHGGEE